jgi:hypothetical protein
LLRSKPSAFHIFARVTPAKHAIHPSGILSSLVFCQVAVLLKQLRAWEIISSVFDSWCIKAEKFFENFHFQPFF